MNMIVTLWPHCGQRPVSDMTELDCNISQEKTSLESMFGGDGSKHEH